MSDADGGERRAAVDDPRDRSGGRPHRARLEQLPDGRRHGRDAGHGGRDPEEELHGVHADRRRQDVLSRHHHQVRPQGVPAAADHRRDRRVRQDRQRRPDDHADGIARPRSRRRCCTRSWSRRRSSRAPRSTQTADASGNYTLSSTEVAQRLSFMLWGSIPDDALNTAADNNQLSTPAQILTQATRMLTSDKARLKIADFHRSYILMGPNTRWDQANKDTTLFPAFNTNLVPTLMAETEKFFDSVAVGEEGDVPGPVPQPDGVRDRIDGAALRPVGVGLRHRLQGDGAGREPAARLPDPRRLPERLRVLQPHVADSPRRLHHEAGAGHADRHTAAGRGGDGAAARLGRPEHEPQAGRRADDRRCLRDLPPRLHQPGRLLDGGVQRRRHLADEGAVVGRGDRHDGRRRHRRSIGRTSTTRSI